MPNAFKQNHEFRHLSAQTQSLENRLGMRQEQQQAKKLERLLEHSYDLNLLHKINEGNNGVILELDLGSFPKRERQKFCKYFGITPEDEDGVAVKMLKIYGARQAEMEFNAQAMAADAINNDEELRGKIAVPRCFYGGDLDLESERFKEKMRELGVNRATDHLGMIMMEYVEGDDLGVFCFKHFIKENFEKYKELNGIRPEATTEEADLYLNSQSIDQLINSCHELLGRKPKFQYFDDSPEATHERNEFSTLILRPLENKGLLDKEVVSAIKAAIEALHNNGIYHRDLHPRNIILGKNGQTYIIDFGSAKIVERSENVSEAEIYHDEIGSRSRDESLLAYLGKLAMTPEEDKEQKSKLDLSAAILLRNIISGAGEKPDPDAREKRALAAWLNLRQAVESGQELSLALKSFAQQLGEYEIGDAHFNCQIAGLMLLRENGNAKEVDDFISGTLNQGAIKPVFARKLNSLRTMK